MTLEKTADSAQAWLVSLLKQMGMSVDVQFGTPDLTEKFKGFGGTWLTIQTTDLSESEVSSILGDRGRNLDALQSLLNLTLNLGVEEEARQTFTLEIDDFRTKRYAELAELAVDAADKVRSSQQEYEMPPLSAAERRLVHTLLVDDSDLSTFSRGQDRDRRLIVCPAEISA